MKKTNEHEPDWPRMLQDHAQTCQSAEVCVRELSPELQRGGDTASLVDQLGELLLEVRREAVQLCQVLHDSPVCRIFSAARLNITEQQYLLAHAAGLNCFTAESLGVSPISDYEAYRLCVYEDDDSVGFWHPEQAPPGPQQYEGSTIVVRGRIARSPEEVDIAHFRPEQVEFINTHRPDLLPRLGLMKRDRREQPDAEAAALPQGRE